MTAAAAAPRLDLYLAETRGISRTAAQTLISAGLVTVNGKPAKAGEKIGAGVQVEVDETAAQKPDPSGTTVGPAVDLQIVYEDEWLAVIDKPAGLVVHPAAGHPHGTLADGLRQRGSTWSMLGGSERAGIVHRLDRDTSGLLVVAKTEAAHRHLAAQLADRSLRRTYWGLVWGVVEEQSGTIDAPIGRDPRDRKRMAVVDGARASITDFRVVERLEEFTLLDVDLRSGRTHQIRVHLAHIGKPLVGDPVYGRRSDPHRSRPALHARRLGFVHPGDGQQRSFDSPLPVELELLLASLRNEQ